MLKENHESCIEINGNILTMSDALKLIDASIMKLTEIYVNAKEKLLTIVHEK